MKSEKLTTVIAAFGAPCAGARDRSSFVTSALLKSSFAFWFR